MNPTTCRSNCWPSMILSFLRAKWLRKRENFALYILPRVTDRSDLNRIADFDPTRNTLLARSLDVQNVKII